MLPPHRGHRVALSVISAAGSWYALSAREGAFKRMGHEAGRCQVSLFRLIAQELHGYVFELASRDATRRTGSKLTHLSMEHNIGDGGYVTDAASNSYRTPSTVGVEVVPIPEVGK